MRRFQTGPAREEAVSGVVRIKATLRGIEPPIWRRIQVPANLTLRRLHFVLQRVMGWKDTHPHRFRVGDTIFGMPSADSWKLRDSRWVTLQDLLSSGTKAFTYEYDFDDGWEHQLKIEGMADGDPGNQLPVCLAGERACPPESSGGPAGYRTIQAAMKDPAHEEHQHVMRWLPPGFDPELFDLEEVNASLATLR